MTAIDSAKHPPLAGKTFSLQPYRAVRAQIQSADLLLFRRCGESSWFSWLITVAGRSVWSHAAKASWWNGDLFLIESLGGKGIRAVTLSSQVRRFPGRIDVFRANAGERWPEYDREGADQFMRRLTGQDYGTRGMLKVAMLHLPVVRFWIKPILDDTDKSPWSPFCSHACAMADHCGGNVDPVRKLADRLTEPADLARSLFYDYQFTLDWEESECSA